MSIFYSFSNDPFFIISSLFSAFLCQYVNTYFLIVDVFEALFKFSISFTFKNAGANFVPSVTIHNITETNW